MSDICTGQPLLLIVMQNGWLEFIAEPVTTKRQNNVKKYHRLQSESLVFHEGNCEQVDLSVRGR